MFLDVIKQKESSLKKLAEGNIISRELPSLQEILVIWGQSTHKNSSTEI